MNLLKRTGIEVAEAVKTSFSFAQVLRKLEIPCGGDYTTIKTLINRFQLDTSHFKGQAHNKGKIFGPKYPIEDYLNNQRFIYGHALRLRLLREGILERRCNICNGTEWLDSAMPLELDHIDGNKKNNNLSNLRILCPNCHTLTPTYKVKNRKSPRNQKSTGGR